MPGLLNCVTEPGVPYGCCVEDPYVLQEIDCVRQCLLALKRPINTGLLASYAGGIRFATGTENSLGMLMQDNQILVDLLVDIFDERRATILRTGTDPGVTAIWEDHDLDCVATYFRCHHNRDLREWFLKAGLYDPANPPVQAVLDALPRPYDIPCGDPVPDPPTPPGPWPPPSGPCEVDVLATTGNALIDTDDLPGLVGGASEGDVYVANISGAFFDVDIIATFTSGVFVQYDMQEGELVSVAGTVYVSMGGALLPYFSPITIVYQGTPGSYVATTNFVSVAATYNRLVILEATDNGTDWTAVWAGQEIAFIGGVGVNTTPMYPTAFRALFYTPYCEYGRFDVTLDPVPHDVNVMFGTKPEGIGVNIRIFRGDLQGVFAQVYSTAPLGVAPVQFYRLRKTEVPSTQVAIGWNGTIRRTTNGGTNWTTPGGGWSTSPDVPDQDATALRALHYAGNGLFTIAGYGGALYMSTDNGVTFDPVPIDPSFLDMTAVAAFDDQTILVGTELDGLWRTADAGATWTQILAGQQVSHLEIIGNNVMCFVYGPTTGVFYSTDGGVTFGALNGDPLEVEETEVRGNIVWGVGSGRCKSMDGGVTWTVQGVGTTKHFGVAAIDDNVVLFTISNEVFLSTDGGATVTSIFTNDQENYGIEAYVE